MKAIFSWSVRVYYEDTDAVGVVYYANYLKFYERAWFLHNKLPVQTKSVSAARVTSAYPNFATLHPKKIP